MARHSRVRLADVAQLVGVSTTTASRALNGRGEISDATRAAVLEAADRLGFRPSPFAQSSRSMSFIFSPRCRPRGAAA